MKKRILFSVLLFFILPVFVNAEDIEITSLQTSIQIEKDKTAVMTENYELYFINDVEEFDRLLDTSINVIRKNNSGTIIKPNILDISTEEQHTIYDVDKRKKIAIKILGQKDTSANLSLKYKYDFGKDDSRSYDEFYYNLISNFDNIISDVQFEIILPDSEYNNISFYINGRKVKSETVSYTKEGNIITGYLNNILDYNDVFSVRIEFPEGYFHLARDNFNYLNYLYLVLPIISLIIVIIYWFKYAKGNKIKKKYSYYPPNNFDPAEIGYLYKGKTDESDLGSLVIYLANNGYLKLEENDDGYKLGKENSFNFIKVKDYKKRNAAQKLIFNGIFKDREVATLSDIEYSFASKLMDAKKTLDNSDNKKKMFNIDIDKSKLVVMIMVAISVLLLTITPVKEFTNSYLLVPVLTLTMLFGLAIISIIDVALIPKIILGMLFIGGTIGLNVYSLIGLNNYLIIYTLGIALVLITTFIFKKLPQRTKFGNEKLGEVEGFRINLASMNITKLKELLEENPNYYYDMIPYVMVFDMLDSWISIGTKLELDRPNWHITNEAFDLKKESKFFKNVVFTSTQVMIKGLYVSKDSAKLEFKRDLISSELDN